MVAASSANLKQKFRLFSIVSQHSQPPPRRIHSPSRAPIRINRRTAKKPALRRACNFAENSSGIFWWS